MTSRVRWRVTGLVLAAMCGGCSSGSHAAGVTPADAGDDTDGDSGGAFTSSRPGDQWEGETHLAVSASGQVAAVWIADQASYIGYAFSSDSGSTWTPAQALHAPSSGDEAWDPAVAVDAANNFYVSFLALGANARVYVAEAPTGTMTFGAPSEVTDPVESGLDDDGGKPLFWYDKPWIAVTRDQGVVVTYTRFDGCHAPFVPGSCVADVMLGRSTNGASWTRTAITASASGDGGKYGGFAESAFPCVSASTGRLWVVYDSIEPPGAAGTPPVGVVLQYSDDGGATWSAGNTTVVAPATATGVLDGPSCAGDGMDVWVEYELADPNGTFASSIQVARSANGGQSFGAPVNAQDMATSAHSWHGAIALESSGELDVEYYGGADEGDPQGSVYYTHSTGGGATWGKAQLIKSPITLTSKSGGDIGSLSTWLGDYLGVTTAGGVLYTTYTDNASGTAHVAFAKQSVPP